MKKTVGAEADSYILALLEEVKGWGYLNKSEFIREAIREHAKRIKAKMKRMEAQSS